MNFDPGLRKVATALYCHLNTPRSLACEILLRYGEWGQLASVQTDPRNYLEGSVGAERYRRDVQAGDFLRKSPLLGSSGGRKAAAEEIFLVCEKQCRFTNKLLELLHYPSVGEMPHEDAQRKIYARARKIAGRILGRVPDSIQGAFGPGTSFELKGQPFSTVADKLWITPHATEACMPLFEHMFWPTFWGRTRLREGLPLPATSPGNRFTTVPKDSTKDRGICVEPLGNLWVQLGIGRYLKRRLKAVGIDVARSDVPSDPIKLLTAARSFTGQDLHQRLARDGSASGDWATIDLSNASDTVSVELVRWILPPDWFELLYACRSPFTLFKGEWVQLEKFSSMGNGFTFELETLLFCCILSAACGLKVGHDLFVYGDDIIVPTTKGRDAVAILEASGFTPNVRKTFLSGPFRESCGGDFFSGYPVRPYQADGKFESPLEWVSLHNEILAKWPGASLVAKRAVEQVPLKLRLFGPRHLGDRVFHGPATRTWIEDGIRWLATIVARPSKIPLDRWSGEFHFVLACLGVSSEGITPRDSQMSYLISRASVS